MHRVIYHFLYGWFRCLLVWVFLNKKNFLGVETKNLKKFSKFLNKLSKSLYTDVTKSCWSIDQYANTITKIFILLKNFTILALLLSNFSNFSLHLL